MTNELITKQWGQEQEHNQIWAKHMGEQGNGEQNTTQQEHKHDSQSLFDFLSVGIW